MKLNLNKKQSIAIALVLAAGVVLAGLILGTAKTRPDGEGHEHADGMSATDAGHRETEAGPRKGPHGGRLFTQDGYGIELTLFEQGVEPHFRLYTYRDGKPLDPKASQVTVTVERLGRKPQLFTFAAEKDYLKGDAVVEEPHSFKVTIDARYDNKAYRFDYEQVEARVAMSDEQLRQNQVEVLTAGPARIRNVLQLIGEIRLNQDRTVRVVPRFSGIVQSVSANAGDRVRKGQLLATISSQGLSDQRAELLAAQKRLALARATFDREKKLWEDKISAEQDYLQAHTALQEAEIAVQNAQQKLASLGSQRTGGDLTRYELRSPIDGIVVEKHIAQGEAVKEDATVFVIADLSTVWAEMTVYAKDLNAVKVGQKATVKAAAFDSTSSGTVFYVGSLVGEQTRTAKARIVLPNPQGVWRPGLPVNIELVAGEVEVPVAVSQEAIHSLRDWTVVFGRYGADFEARLVKLGRSDGRFVEVVEGLNAGEHYAAKNSFLIKAELGKAGASHDH
ncbi:MAG: efflux transporter periplasmic adaptor subunit [Azospira oryzae]|nr:MAG: efflux transporter periplasmic adaptor subunit [Azospira oryzae]PZP79955.1 MAG: efflux transporter periplasmic adaptor subunit [Azospira oryzae]